MGSWSLLLFDLDDTLFDYTRCWGLATRRAFSLHESTRDLDQDKLFAAYRLHDDELWKLLARGGIRLRELRWVRFSSTLADLGITTTEAVCEDFLKLYRKVSMDFVEPDPRVNALIDRVKERYEVGIITNGGSEQWEKLDRLRLREQFEDQHVFISDELGIAKPDPRIFEMALARFHDTPSERALFIGDSWENDVVGALRAGLDAVWINPDSRERTTSDKPLAEYRSILEAQELLL